MLVPDYRERTATPRILDANPGEGRVQIVAAIHEPRAGLHLLAECHGRDLVARPDCRGKSEGALRVHRDAEPVLLNQLDAAAREAIIDTLVNKDALQPTAGLTGIEVGTVHDVFNSMGQIGIVTHVDRVAAAELETHSDEALG